MREITKGLGQITGMSDPKHERDSDRDSLTGWTLVDREGTPEDNAADPPQQEEEDGAVGTDISPEDDAAEEEAEDESGCGMEEDEQGEEEEDEEEPLPDDLVTMGQRVQEIKGDADLESLASTDISVLDGEEKKVIDEETDLSLASTPALPDDLPTIKPDTQYRHTPAEDLNGRLNVIVALTIACVLGLGLGHFLGLTDLSVGGDTKGWSSRTVWQESLNSAQIIENLNLENSNLQSEMSRLQQQNIAPIKIRGKDGKHARALRERINHLIIDNEELRVALGKMQYANVPDGDPNLFDDVMQQNHRLRMAVSKLSHLVPSLEELKVSANDLQSENQELQIQVGKLRYQQQPMPRELNAVAREVENLQKTVEEASRKKKSPT